MTVWLKTYCTVLFGANSTKIRENHTILLKILLKLLKLEKIKIKDLQQWIMRNLDKGINS